MSVFGNDFRSGYEEIMTYSPSYYRDVLEMEAIYQASGKMLENMADGLESAVSNRFVETMDAETVGRMERFLYIPQAAGRSLESRKKVVLSVLLGSGKLSASRLKEIIGAFTDLPVTITFPDSKLLVNLTMDEGGSSYMADITRAFKARLPAHLAYVLSGNYGGGGKHNISAGAGLQIISHCYPRFNMAPLIMDGLWSLDGTYLLTGYKDESFLDFYPTLMSISVDTKAQYNTSADLSLQYSVCDPVQYDNSYYLISSVHPQNRDPCYPVFLLINQNTVVEQSTGTIYSLRSNASVKGTADTEINTAAQTIAKPDAGASTDIVSSVKIDICIVADMTVEHNLWCMDGSVSLDGGQTLDAEVYNVSL